MNTIRFDQFEPSRLIVTNKKHTSINKDTGNTITSNYMALFYKYGDKISPLAFDMFEIDVTLKHRTKSDNNRNQIGMLIWEVDMNNEKIQELERNISFVLFTAMKYIIGNDSLRSILNSHVPKIISAWKDVDFETFFNNEYKFIKYFTMQNDPNFVQGKSNEYNKYKNSRTFFFNLDRNVPSRFMTIKNGQPHRLNSSCKFKNEAFIKGLDRAELSILPTFKFSDFYVGNNKFSTKKVFIPSMFVTDIKQASDVNDFVQDSINERLNDNEFLEKANNVMNLISDIDMDVSDNGQELSVESASKALDDYEINDDISSQLDNYSMGEIDANLAFD